MLTGEWIPTVTLNARSDEFLEPSTGANSVLKLVTPAPVQQQCLVWARQRLGGSRCGFLVAGADRSSGRNGRRRFGSSMRLLARPETSMHAQRPNYSPVRPP